MSWRSSWELALKRTIPNAGVESGTYAREGSARVFRGSGEHAEYTAGVLAGVSRRVLPMSCGSLRAREDAQGGLVGVEGFGNAQVVEFDVSGVHAVAGCPPVAWADEGDGTVGAQGGFVHGSAVVVDPRGVSTADCAELTVELRAGVSRVFAALPRTAPLDPVPRIPSMVRGRSL